MTQRETIEQQIREILASETSAIALSQKLFHPKGLFAQLATTEEERRLLAQADLFREAQRRLSDLQRQEAAAFAQAVAQFVPTMTVQGIAPVMLPVPRTATDAGAPAANGMSK
jgi:hypothetical protein